MQEAWFRFPWMMMVFAFTTAGVSADELVSSVVQRSSMKSLQVACVQLETTGDLSENAQRIARAISAEAEQGTRLVVFPECGLTSYDASIIRQLTAARIEAALAKVQEACRESDVYAVVGSADRRDGQWYNVAYVIDPRGRIIKRYAKLHVVKPDLFANGNELAIFRIDDVPATIMICHDERYPEIFRIPVLAGARLGIYISCEEKTPAKRDNYRCQIIARAVENQVAVVHCNAGEGGADGGSHGHSRIIDAQGNVLAEAGSTAGDVIRAVIHPERSSNTHARNGAATPSLRRFWAEGLRALRKQNPEFFAQPTASQPAAP